MIAKDKKCDKFHLDETKRNSILIASVLLSVSLSFNSRIHFTSNLSYVCVHSHSFCCSTCYVRWRTDRLKSLRKWRRRLRISLANCPFVHENDRMLRYPVLDRPFQLSFLRISIWFLRIRKFKASEKKDPDDESKGTRRERGGRLLLQILNQQMYLLQTYTRRTFVSALVQTMQRINRKLEVMRVCTVVWQQIYFIRILVTINS